MLVVLIRRHWICRETKFGVERHASFLACIACCFLWNYRFILESRATSSSCSFFYVSFGIRVHDGFERFFVIESLGMVFLFHFPHWTIFCFVWRNLYRHWSWVSSSWVCITSVRQLQHHSTPSTNHRCFHPFFFFFLFWEPVLPSFRKVMRRHCHFGRLLPAKRTRALPLPDSDSPPLLSRVISPDDSPASRMPSLYFLAPLWLCCPIFCAFLRSKSAALPPVSTLEPW